MNFDEALCKVLLIRILILLELFLLACQNVGKSWEVDFLC